jgi:hypothetical protein
MSSRVVPIAELDRMALKAQDVYDNGVVHLAYGPAELAGRYRA